MKLNRNFITPFISLVFFVVGLSGLLMFFHLFDGYTEIVHEYLGIFFVICTVFHIMVNWKGLKVHFKKGVFLPTLWAVLIISLVLIISQKMYPPLDTVILSKIVKAPIIDAFQVLDINYDKASDRLKKNGLIINNAKSIEDIWINNKTNPKEVINLLME